MNRLFLIGLVACFLVGVGCTTAAPSGDPQATAEQLDLRNGSTLKMASTVFGLSDPWGMFSDDPERAVTVREYLPGQSVAVDWTMSYQRETEASIAARQRFVEEFTPRPIGEKDPEPPEPVFETVTESGSLHTDALDDGDTLLIPRFWLLGESNSGADRTLIWLSRAQYDELTQTKRTHLSLGSIDEQLQWLQDIKNTVDTLVAEFQDAPTAVVDRQELIAEDEWGTSTLIVDGKEQRVRVIKASNFFATLVILANPDNPLVLKLTPNVPGGSVGEAVVETVWNDPLGGYAVTAIDQP